jgi:hypothetical protein
MAIASLEKPPTTALPRSIRRGLSRVDHRLRAVGAARGLGKSALLLAVVAAVAMALDVAFVLPMAIRWAIWATWVVAGAIALLRGFVRPLVRRTSWNDLAAVAESGETTLGERLTSAVGLLRQRSHGSPVLIAALVDDAAERVRNADLTHAISSRSALSSLFVGLAAVALVVVPAFVRPYPYRNLWQRFLTPWADIDRIGRFAVEVSPGDKVIAIGSDVKVAATVVSRFGEATPNGDAWLEWTAASGSPNQVRMVAEPAGTGGEQTFAVTLPKQTESLSYRVVFGRDRSRLYQITAIDAPGIASLKAHIEPPPYTKRPGYPARDTLRLDAWEDSRITLELEGSRPLKQVELNWPWQDPERKSSTEAPSVTLQMMSQAADGRRWTTLLAAATSGPFAFRLRDEFDLESLPDARYRLTVRPDLPPTLAVATPSDLKETSSDDLLTVAIVAHDDVAVASAELHYTIERAAGSTGPALGHETAPLTGLGTPSARGEAALKLKSLSLQPGDVISYRVRVADNRPAPRGPNVAWSATYGLKIIEHSESLLARQGSAEREALRARLEAIRKTAQANRQETEKLRNDADAVRTGNGTWDEKRAQTLVDTEASARSVTDQLQILARDLDEHPTFQPLARPARQLADVENAAARVSLEAARRASDAPKRVQELQQAGLRLNVVSTKLDELLRKFDELARRDDDRRRLRVLAERQNDLADQVDKAAKNADSRAIDPILAEQERLRRELDELLKNSPALRAEALNAQAREADELAVRARALAAKQREEARRTTNDNARRSALKALTEQERAVEDDARRLALVIDEPLAQNGRGRTDVDALTRTTETIERGDVDQARERSREAENALNRLTRDLEDVRNDPKALARRLAQRQEALKNETVAAVRDTRENPPQTPEGKAALASRLKPMTVRQEAIARLAAAIPAPPEQKDVARQAAKTTAQARDDLREPRPREVEGHQNEARDALNRLADALPDPNQRRQRAREKLNEVRSWSEEVARDLETHLRETAPKPGQPYDPAKAAADLAQRVTSLARRQREIALAIAAIDPEPRAIPQRDRAARRALAMADALDSLRQQAPSPAATETKPDEPRPLATWRVVGAFPIGDKDPFPIDKPVDLTAKYRDRKGQQTTWKPAVPVDNQGTVDLGQIYSKDDKLSAFGYNEIPSPLSRTARMLIGSDDTLTVWLNGKTVYDYREHRSYGPGTDHVDVSLNQGINRILIKCGNLSGEWKFSVGVTPPPEVYRPIAGWRVLGRFASADKPPVATDGPVDLNKKHNNRKGQPTSWQAAKPVNDKGAIDLAAIYSNRDGGNAAFGYAEVPSIAARQARMLIGSNDTFTCWVNGKQVYDSQVSRSWAPDHARIEVPLEKGINRIVVKCGNTGGPWMYSVALSEDPASRPADAGVEIAQREPSFERHREALPANRIATKASLERLQQKLDGQQPADDLAEALAEDQRDLKASQSHTQPAPDPVARAEAAADQRRLANALHNLDAPDAPVAKAEAIHRAEEAARVLEAVENDSKPAAVKEALARAAAAAEALASQLNDRQSTRERARALSIAQRVLAIKDVPIGQAEQARLQHAIADELARLPAEGKGEAAQLVARAAEVGDQAARIDIPVPPSPIAIARSRDDAAKALDRLVQSLRDEPGPDSQPPVGAEHAGQAPATARTELSVPEDPELGVNPAQVAAAADLARRQRHIREGLQAILGEGIEPQRALLASSAALGRDVAELRERSRETSPRAQGSANAAADLLGRSAPETMERATEGLHQGHPGEALQAQRYASDLTEQAARHIEDVAASLRADRAAEPHDPSPGELAAAQAAQREAGQHLSEARGPAQSPTAASQATRAAASAMHKAAECLRAASQTSHEPSLAREPALARNGASPQDSRALTSQTDITDLSQLKAALRTKTGRAWGELPGHLRTEILQMSQGRYREEYARLIELYFREIAADASSRGAKP